MRGCVLVVEVAEDHHWHLRVRARVTKSCTMLDIAT